MAEAFLGEIRPVGFLFAPKGWAFCSGQILPISQNTALFSLLGTTYGGNGTTNFGLPDLRGRAPIHFGQGPGLSNYVEGEMFGEEAVVLTVATMPAHNHVVHTNSTRGKDHTMVGDLPAKGPQNTYGPPTGEQFAGDIVQLAGGSQPHSNIQPSTGINYIIALQGIFPSRN